MMKQHIKEKWIGYCGIFVMLISSTYLFVTSILDLNKFSKEVQIILKANECKTAIVMSRKKTPNTSVIKYTFKTTDGKKYYMKLAMVTINKKYFPKLGEKKVIITSPSLDTCLLVDIKDKQIFSYKVYCSIYMVFGVFGFLLTGFFLVAMILQGLGKIK